MPKIQLSHVELYYESAGQGPPILFIPGLATGGNMWNFVVSQIAPSHQCITIDNRGAGLSDSPKGPYTIEDLAQDTAELLQTLNIVRPAVVGHSMGGFIALQLATFYPISSLILCSTAALGALTAETQQMFRMVSRKQAVQKMAQIGLGANTASSTRALFVDTLLSRPVRGTGYTAQLGAVRQFDLMRTASAIHIATCIIHGTSDTIIPISLGKSLHALLPNASLETIDGCGHFPQIEFPNEVSRILLSHLSFWS